MRPFASPMMMGGAGKKTLFATNFSEYTVGAQPSDWTRRFPTSATHTALVQSVSGSLSGKALRVTKTASADTFWSWDKVPPIVDKVEILFRFRRIEAMTSGNRIVGAWTMGGDAVKGVYNIVDTTGSSNYRVSANRTPTPMADSFQFVITSSAVNEWCWLRTNFTRPGSIEVNTKLWSASNSEPATVSQQRFVSSASFDPTGLSGLFSQTANPNVEIDYFAVDITANTIPLPI